MVIPILKIVRENSSHNSASLNTNESVGATARKRQIFGKRSGLGIEIKMINM